MVYYNINKNQLYIFASLFSICHHTKKLVFRKLERDPKNLLFFITPRFVAFIVQFLRRI